MQAVNKLAEIMNRKEVRAVGSRRGNDTDMRRKEKENRKLQLELRSEKEKLNSSIIKYQKEISEIQAVSGGFLFFFRNPSIIKDIRPKYLSDGL